MQRDGNKYIAYFVTVQTYYRFTSLVSDFNSKQLLQTSFADVLPITAEQTAETFARRIYESDVTKS